MKNEWVSVDDALPADGQKILATDGKSVFSAEYAILEGSGSIYFFTHGVGGYDIEFDFSPKQMTFWMPLPKPPLTPQNK